MRRALCYWISISLQRAKTFRDPISRNADIRGRRAEVTRRPPRPQANAARRFSRPGNPDRPPHAAHKQRWAALHELGCGSAALLILLSALRALSAQETVAPAGLPVGPVRGADAGGYNIVDSIETGYRFAAVSGDRDQYKSTVNYGNGIRLFSSSLTIDSKDGHGRYFDNFVLVTQGLGNDPYESATLRAAKKRMYRYDLLWRSNDYFNPGYTISAGLHRLDLNHRWQDHDLVLFPQGRFRPRLGYSHNSQTGAALTTTLGFDASGSAFPLFADVKREWNEYRVGAELQLFQFKLNVLRRWEFYKEDSPLSLTTPQTGNDPGDPSVLNSLHRAEPFHGSTPGWLVNLFTERRHLAVNGRFTQSSGNRRFIQAENAFGLDRLGFAANRQITVQGNAQRPVVTGQLGVSLYAGDRITVVNSTAFHNIRMDGNSAYTEFDNASFAGASLSFEFLGIRLIQNSTDVHYRARKTFDVYSGYRYASRQIRSIQNETFPSVPFTNVEFRQTNHLHAGVAGLNWTPLPAIRLHLEAEVGRNDRPFTPTADARYHALNGVLQYRIKPFQFRAGYQQHYNNNSVVVTAYSSRARNTYADAAWNIRPSLALDAAYSHLHLDTRGGIAYFAASEFVTGFSSIYSSNIHAANLGFRAAPTKRTDLYIAYSLTRDTGGTFPLSYQAPLARLSIRLHEKLRWNGGYQYYRYTEDRALFSRKQNYRAHTGYTSLTWTF